MTSSSKKIFFLLILLSIIFLVSPWGLPRILNLEKEAPTSLIEESSKVSTGEWHLVSGGQALIQEGQIGTIQGALSSSSKWRKAYLRKNPLDTNNGFLPQNIFLLLSREIYEHPLSQVYFNIQKTNLTESPNRSEWNGVYLVSRHKDTSNFYLAGLRVDGQASIRKKVAGVYTTLAVEPVFTSSVYDKDLEPNLIPQDKWTGLRSTLTTDVDGRVRIVLEGDLAGTGEWQVLAEAVDSGVLVEDSAPTGLKSDFMDVIYTGYSVEEI